MYRKLSPTSFYYFLFTKISFALFSKASNSLRVPTLNEGKSKGKSWTREKENYRAHFSPPSPESMLDMTVNIDFLSGAISDYVGGGE